VRIADGCGEGGNACPSDYECRVPGNNGAGLCTPKGMGEGLSYSNIVVGAPTVAARQQQPPPAAAPVAAIPKNAPAPPLALAPLPVAPKQQQPVAPKQQQPVAPKQQQPVAPKQQQPVAPKQQQPVAPKQQQPVAPVAVQPPRPTAPPALGPPKPAAIDLPAQTVTVTGVWTPRGQNPPRPLREPTVPIQQQPIRPPPQSQPIRPPPQSQPIRPPPYAAGQPGGRPPPQGNGNAQPQRPPPQGYYPNQPIVDPRPPTPPRQQQQQQQQQQPRPAKNGRKLPLRVGGCSQRERAQAKCRLTELCFPHPVRPVCLNPTTADDCGYSRNQKLFGLGRFKECRAGQMCLADYRATDGDDGICAVEPK
jgi:hypothetical protein